MPPDLPSDLKAALERATFGVSRNAAAQRAAAISRAYRGGHSSRLIADAGDALAYALTRMPATYAAVAACLDALRTALPGFAPASLLDVGAGPGTASFAGAELFASLSAFGLIDANPALRDLALRLTAESARLRQAEYRLGYAATELAAASPADLVVASYVLAELPPDEAMALAERMWTKTAGVLLIVEPGTPDGWRRILAARTQLVAQGGRVAAPCPHDAACPLAEPDWCHFSQRLPRSRDHKQVKQADAPFEDEKFAYIALSRLPVPQRPARVLAPPVLTKAAVTARLCTPTEVAMLNAPRRDKLAYAAARRLRWGDTVTDEALQTHIQTGVPDSRTR
jgi:ribosomal protein RSM22 (predicted rRNA methylase)